MSLNLSHEDLNLILCALSEAAILADNNADFDTAKDYNELRIRLNDLIAKEARD